MPRNKEVRAHKWLITVGVPHCSFSDRPLSVSCLGHVIGFSDVGPSVADLCFRILASLFSQDLR